MKRAAIVLFVVTLGLGAWFFVSPLFIDEAVDEPFDFVLPNGELDLAAVGQMATDERQSMMGEIMTAAAAAPDKAMSEALPEGPIRLAQGRFVDADALHKGRGQATLYQLPDGSHLVRFEDFRTTNGPALVVYLARHANPSDADDVTAGGFIELGRLKGNVGSQNYAVPSATPVEEFNSVVIWCELFGVLFSPAALTPL